MKFTLLLFFFGLFFTIFHLFLVFKSGFAEKFILDEEKDEGKEDFLTKRQGYLYYRYGQGVRGLIISLILLIFATIMLLR